MTSNDDAVTESDIYAQDDEFRESDECETAVTESDIYAQDDEFRESDECETAVTDFQEPEQERKERKLPSQMSQVISVFGLQMRMYSKSKLVYLFIFLTFLIPVFVYTDMIHRMPIVGDSIANLLFALPLMMVIIPPMLAGKILSSEFKNKTAYLMFPLPVSRTAFYFGKFLASFILSTGIFSLAYGLAIYSGLSMSVLEFPIDFLGSYIICIAGVFAITAIAYGLGTMFKKGSVSLTITLSMVLLYFLPLLLDIFSEKIPLVVIDYMKLLPQFNGLQALFVMDAGFVFIMPDFKEIWGTGFSPYFYLAASAIWGILFLLMGLKKILKKEL